MAYCYIRKNASTAFKRLILDLSPHRSAIDQSKSRIQFMGLYHRESRIDALESCDYRIFVYRDVLERIASLFANKFKVRSGAEDIMKDISRRFINRQKM
ncbi:sulfotransferase family 2 domain-containing protein [Lamprobacter sp.]|uniref:sulfotransferase family 2 domain-containing protein n=1 Tax=Lamprobacter sp. TaxID=3100796 RepID=UPI003A4D3B48